MPRLIDADALDMAFTNLRFNQDMSLAHWGDRKDWCLHGHEVEKLIHDAPTIGGWISVKDRPPEEHKSIFYKLLGTPKWSSSMWKQESDKVIVYVSFPDGTGVVTTGCLHDSDWTTTVSKALPQTVTHWMPLPEPPTKGEAV